MSPETWELEAESLGELIAGHIPIWDYDLSYDRPARCTCSAWDISDTREWEEHLGHAVAFHLCIKGWRLP